jgi:hypothetical protein
LPFEPGPEVWALPESYYLKLENAERERAEVAAVLKEDGLDTRQC